MWKFDIRFDTRFFAVAYSLLGHTEVALMNWLTDAIRNFAKYIAAEKRIQVGLKIFSNY
jgi:membrane protein required for beta-lactamase induction